VHHHRCNPDGMSVEQATRRALATWNREPMFHISSPIDGWKGTKPQRHHDFIDAADFPACWLRKKITVEVEAKAKEVAVLRLLAGLKESAQSGENNAPKSENKGPAAFDYSLDFKSTDFRRRPELYRIGKGEQGVLLVQPYKGEILPYWRFKTVAEAKKSSAKIYQLFLAYLKANNRNRPLRRCGLCQPRLPASSKMGLSFPWRRCPRGRKWKSA
jgi:hypothetical protein